MNPFDCGTLCIDSSSDTNTKPIPLTWPLVFHLSMQYGGGPVSCIDQIYEHLTHQNTLKNPITDFWGRHTMHPHHTYLFLTALAISPVHSMFIMVPILLKTLGF